MLIAAAVISQLTDYAINRGFITDKNSQIVMIPALKHHNVEDTFSDFW